jgi:hypothetical protein
MTDESDIGTTIENAPIFDMKAAKAKFRPKVDGSRKGRMSRHKAVSKSTDGRSLRATGRTEHLNFKALPETRTMIEEAAKHLDIPKSLWLEQIIREAYGKLMNGQVDADHEGGE